MEHGKQEVQDVVLGFAEQQNLGAINGKYGEGVGTMARKQFALEMRKAMGAIRENASFTDLFSRGGPKIEFQVKAKGLDPGLKDRVSNAIAEANRNYQEWASNTEAKDISTGQMGRISDVVNKKNLQNTGTRIHYSIEQDRENEPVTSIYEKLDQNLKAQEGERYGFSSLPTDKQDSLRPIIERAKTGGIEALLPDAGRIPDGPREEIGPSNRRTSQGRGGEDIQLPGTAFTEAVPNTEQLAELAGLPREDIDYLKKEIIDVQHAFGLTDSRNHIESELIYNHIAEIARKNKTSFLAIFGDQKMVGSLSEIFGPEMADQIYARLNRQITEELAKYIGNGRGFIIGGDEQARYYFTDPVSGEKYLRKVLEDVDRRIQAAELDKLPNFKNPDKPETWGVGFYFKTFAIYGSKTYDRFLKEMGVAIELEKKAVSGIVESLDEFFSTKEGKFPILIEGVRNARSSSKQIRIEVPTETKETPKGETLPGSGTLRAPSPPSGRGGKQGVVSSAQPTGTSGKEIKSDIQDVLSPDIVEGRPDDSRQPVGTRPDIGRKESERVSGVSERLDGSPTRSRKLDESKVTSEEEGQSIKDVEATLQPKYSAKRDGADNEFSASSGEVPAEEKDSTSLPQDNNQHLRALEKATSKNGTEDLSNILREVSELTTSQKLLKDSFSELFDVNIVFFEDPTGKLDLNGAVLPSVKNTIFLDVAAEHPLMVVAGHELLHIIRQESPEIYDSLLKTLGQFLIFISFAKPTIPSRAYSALGEPISALPGPFQYFLNHPKIRFFRLSGRKFPPVGQKHL